MGLRALPQAAGMAGESAHGRGNRPDICLGRGRAGLLISGRTRQHGKRSSGSPTMNADQPGALEKARAPILRASKGFMATAHLLRPSAELDGRLMQLYFSRTAWWIAFMLASTLAVMLVS